MRDLALAGRRLFATPLFLIFRTLGVPILRGCQFDDRDAISPEHVTVVSEWTATQLFGSIDSAVGRSIDLQQWQRSPVTFTVIGVARQTDVQRLTARRDHQRYHAGIH
jgi:MacB-like periplasmic core domain